MARLITERADSRLLSDIRAAIIRQLEHEPMDLLPMEVVIARPNTGFGRRQICPYKPSKNSTTKICLIPAMKARRRGIFFR